VGAGADPGLGRPLGAGEGPGWARLAAAVAAALPPGEVETIHVFRPWKRDGREWGTAVVTRRAESGAKLRVYTARYMLIVRGKERGRCKVEVREVALSPAEVLAQVMQATTDRTGDAEPPQLIDRAVWYRD